MFKNFMAAVFCLISNSVVSHISLTTLTTTKTLHSVILHTPTNRSFFWSRFSCEGKCWENHADLWEGTG